MNWKISIRLVPLSLHLVIFFGLQAFAQHGHPPAEQRRASAPTVFLDKSPRVVEYQLQRLSNEQLLLINTATDDKKFLPVFAAILSRDGISTSHRSDALAGLVAINQSNAVVELCTALLRITGGDATAQRSIRTLANMLLNVSGGELFDELEPLCQLAESKSEMKSMIGFAALLAAGAQPTAFEIASTNRTLPLLFQGIPLVPSAAIRDALHATALAATAASEPIAVRQQATNALAHIAADQSQTFVQIAPLIEETDLRDSAVRTLLSIPGEKRDSRVSQELAAWLVKYAEMTPTEERTTDGFLDAMQLVDELIATVPAEQAREYRQRLRTTVVRVVRIRTVAEEMRYDLPHFAVEAGRPVQVILINHDIMPHNLVLTVPGGLKEVAELGLQTGPTGGLDGKQYVPSSDKVLYATDMVNAEQQATLTFTAPTEPGEYPYVCTFPRHWMRMYGVMVVVDDLDAWLKDPQTPLDPVGSNRSFVRNWSVSDFEDLATGLRGRTPEIGKRLFIEASCGQCHKAGELVAGNVGPTLDNVLARWQGNPREVLREILDPSHRIDPKYVVEIIITEDGQTKTGLVVEETKETIAVLENPEATEPTIIEQSEIAGRRQTNNSMMPKGLLDRFSRDEILEIVAFIQSIQTADVFE